MQWKWKKPMGSIALLAAIVVGAGPSFAQTGATSAPADNTRVNKEDRQQGGVTADQQKENKADRELAQRVRRAFTSDKSLSTYARNVKIIAQDGKVTLKGPVRSDAEKQKLEAKAAEVAGEGNVTSQITVRAAQG